MSLRRHHGLLRGNGLRRLISSVVPTPLLRSAITVTLSSLWTLESPLLLWSHKQRYLRTFQLPRYVSHYVNSISSTNANAQAAETTYTAAAHAHAHQHKDVIIRISNVAREPCVASQPNGRAPVTL